MPEARPIKVLRIIDRLNIGGPAIHATLLAKRWDTVLVTGTEGEAEGSMLDWAQREGVRLERIPSLGRELHPFKDLATFWRLSRLIRRERPDVVHTHKSKAGAVGRLAAWLCRVPVLVHTFHGHVLHGYFSPAKSRFFIFIERAMALLSHRLIAVSPKVRDDLLRYRIDRPEKIDVVYLGLDLARFARARRGSGGLRAELGFPPECRLVGIVARLVPIKDIPAFLKTAERVLSKAPETRFVVVGGGELQGELEVLSRRLGLAERVRFMGFQDRLERVYADLDVLTLTSRNEGSPVSLIEGLAAGCAVAAMDVGGVRDVVRDGITGCLTPMGDQAALAQAILRLLDDPAERERLGQAGSRDVLARFSIDRLVRDLDGLYRALLSAAVKKR